MPDDSHTSGAPRFAFVLGTGRCGSTLLHELVARHPDVGFVTNVEDRFGRGPSARIQAGIFRRLPAGAPAKGRPRFAPPEGHRAPGREGSPILPGPAPGPAAPPAPPGV